VDFTSTETAMNATTKQETAQITDAKKRYSAGC